jgi:hypothetical protein
MVDYEKEVKAVMASWPWRAKRLGYTMQDFGASLDIAAPTLCEYTSGRMIPSAPRYLMIETTLRKAEEEAGF